MRTWVIRIGYRIPGQEEPVYETLEAPGLIRAMYAMQDATLHRDVFEISLREA